jgi:hypothetical protein
MIENSQRDEWICPGGYATRVDPFSTDRFRFPSFRGPCVVLWWLFGARQVHAEAQHRRQQQSTTINNNRQQSTMCKQNQAEAQCPSRAAGCIVADDPVAA